ncbi:hypothetical protein QVD17_29704 [Tagetes erecta]|uniref:RWP-RK domain-containing protein n=1 Tax=Tagetes erecta TaxID=13708 RepID=A0AAD8K470_TARER|nr:hypothetical protein QVD17_29704 [Tagetes erecta]
MVQTFASEWLRILGLNDIDVPIDEGVLRNIISTVETLQVPQDQTAVLVQFWAAKNIRDEVKTKMHLLTTTSQPFGFWGSNLLLKAYRKACLHIKIYVYKDFKKQEETVLGPPVPGNVFLYRTPEQTQDVHRYPEDQRPPCDQDAVFDQRWGSFAVPVILADQSCVGVLEFLMDTPKISYDEYIKLVCKHLKHASLHPGNQIDPWRTNKITGRERKRTTKSSPLTKYSCLVPYFGLSKASAIEKLGHAGAVIKESTFKNLCRNIGIPMWPYVKKRTAGASIAPEPSSINQPVHEIDSSTGAPNIADSNNVCDIDQQLIQHVPNIDDTRDSFTGADTQNQPPSFSAPQQTVYTQDIEIQDSFNQADTHRNKEAPFWPHEPSMYTGSIEIQDSFTRPDTRNGPPSFWAPQQTMYTQDIEIQDSSNQADTQNEEAPFWPLEPSTYTGGINIQDSFNRPDIRNEPPSFWAPQQNMYTQDIEIQDSLNQADTQNEEAPFWPLEPSIYSDSIDIQDSFNIPDTRNEPPSFWASQQTMYTQDTEIQDSLNQADTQNEEAPFWPHEPSIHTE